MQEDIAETVTRAPAQMGDDQPSTSAKPEPRAEAKPDTARLGELKGAALTEVSQLDLAQQHHRLIFARSQRYRTASDAARAMGAPQPTYLAHENGSRGMKLAVAETYAQHLGVTTAWLLTGAGPMMREGGAAPNAALPARVPMPESAVNPLVHLLEVAMTPQGKWIASQHGTPAETAMDLPSCAAGRNHLPILADVPNDELRRRVSLKHKIAQPLSIIGFTMSDDFAKLDPDMQLFCFRPPNSTIISNKVYAIVDLRDRKILNEGLYLFAEADGSVELGAIERLKGSPMALPSYRIWFSKEPLTWEPTKDDLESIVVGRVVRIHAPVDEDVMSRVIRPDFRPVADQTKS
jgi:DNA-binding XRE family transcriptional regulator